VTKKEIAKKLINCFNNGNKLLICGNGGSASMAQHMAAELVCTFEHNRRALPAIALTTDTSIITAWSNDRDYRGIFYRQIEALGKPFDVLIVLSTSGRSQNCNMAIQLAQKKLITVIDFPRKGKKTAKIQEYQLKLIHDVCRIVEKAFL